MWKPSTVEDIRAWMAGEYVPDPTREKFDRLWREQLHARTQIRWAPPFRAPTERLDVAGYEGDRGLMGEDRDPNWVVQPLLDAGFDPKHLASLAEWMRFEVIAAEEEMRPISLREIEDHMSPKMRVALREVVRRAQQRGEGPRG